LQTAGRYCSGTALNLCARIDERWLAAREGNLRRLIDDRVRDDGFWILYPERVRSSALTFFCLAPLVLPIRCLEEGQIYPPNQHRLATLHFLSGVHCVAPNYVPARVIVVRLYRNGGDRTEDEDTAVQLHVNGDRHIGCLLGLRTRRKTSGYHGCYQTASPRSELSSKLLILWSHPPGSNRRPADYESAALPTELGWPCAFDSNNAQRISQIGVDRLDRPQESKVKPRTLAVAGIPPKKSASPVALFWHSGSDKFHNCCARSRKVEIRLSQIKRVWLPFWTNP
jgi:hypothetical protein